MILILFYSILGEDTSYKNSLGVSLLYARKQDIHIHHFSLPPFRFLEIVVVRLSGSIAH